MQKIFYTSMLLITAVFQANSQEIIGKWKTVDDITGQPKSIVEFYEKGGKICGKVLDIFDPQHKKMVCINCSGDEKSKPVIGLTIIKGLVKEGTEYNSGKILDPKNGKTYKCFVSFESNDKIKVCGYIGISLFGRTQYWYRIKG